MKFRFGKWESEYQLGGETFYPPLLDADGNPFTDPSARGRKKAEAARAFAKAEHKRRAKSGDTVKQQQRATYSLAQAFAALTPEWKRLANYSNRQQYIRELSEYFGATTALVDITSEKIRRYVEQCRTTKRKRWTGGVDRDSKDAANARFWKAGTVRSDTTTNQYCDTLRAALEFGAEHRVDGKPVLDYVPKVPFFKPDKGEADPLPTAVASELWDLLPQHAREAMVVSLLFGLRRAECFGLTVANIDFENGAVRLWAKDVKEARDRLVAGSPLAMTYLDQLARQARERGTFYLITYREYRKDPVEQAKVAWRPIKKPRHAWESAMAVIETRQGRRWRWHDLRANFISRIANTTGIFAALKLAGHSDVKVTADHYGQLADKERRDAADQVTNRPLIQAMLAGTTLAGVIEPTDPATKVRTESPDGISNQSKKHLKLLK